LSSSKSCVVVLVPFRAANTAAIFRKKAGEHGVFGAQLLLSHMIRRLRQLADERNDGAHVCGGAHGRCSAHAFAPGRAEVHLHRLRARGGRPVDPLDCAAGV
jgi:hypothetical protein